MGVTGLLQHLKEIQEPTDLSKFKGKSLAVDTYGWLHRGLMSCAIELCEGIPTRKYITSVLKKVDMLRHFGVEPYLVFDGADLPTKGETVKERMLKREEAKIKAEKFTSMGNRTAAWKEYMKAAAVTSEMAKSIMVELDARGVRYVVAPYEADPQMVYLEKIGLVDGILSEDSDLLIFGCNTLVTKLNDFGECIEICRKNFDKVKKVPGLASFTEEQLRIVAMLSGCDYTKGFPGIGLKTAFNLVRKHGSFEKVLHALRNEGKKVPDNIEDEVFKANLAFQFQKVFNPVSQTLETLNEYPADLSVEYEVLESCCGKTINEYIHAQICNGIVHPNTHDILISREQKLTDLKSKSTGALPTSLSNGNAALSLRTKSFESVAREKTINSYFKVSKPPKAKMINTSESKSDKEKPSTVTKSPLSRKVNKLMHLDQSYENVSPNKKLSQFFHKDFQTAHQATNHQKSSPCAKILKLDPAGESDISETFSSPMQQNTNLEGKFEILDSIEDTDNDNPGHESPTKRDDTPEGGIDISPTKSTYKLKTFALALREKYLNDSTYISKKHTDAPIKRKVLAPKDPNRNIQPVSKTKLNGQISHIAVDDASKITKPVPSFRKSHDNGKAATCTSKKHRINLLLFAFGG